MRRGLIAALVSLTLLAPARPAAAQDFATLLADRVSVDPDGAVTAEGNVEVFYRDARLTATRLRYERAGERLIIEGPITLAEGADVSVLADAAELDADLRNGILTGAQMVLDQEFQIASPRIERVDGRYVALSNAVATSCRVCAGNPTPIWEIRAARVIHDTELRRIYFENAQFRLAGVPLAYLPRFSMPDPTVDRARGFLAPRIVNSSLLSFGLQTPYFLPIGDHADVLLTPWVSDVTTTLIGRYRQQFRFGYANVNGAISDDLLTDDLRAFVFADWRFLLPGEFVFGGDIELVSDPSYLSNYSFSGKDRLDSSVFVSRTNSDEDILFEYTAFRTLRDIDLATRDQVTGRLLEGRYERALPTGGLGGAAWARFDTTALVRPSDVDILGRDVSRIGAEAVWRNDIVTAGGLVAAAELGLGGDLYLVADDSSFEDVVLRASPASRIDLRWPFQRSDGGVSHLIEPALMLAWSETSGGEVPNEDSTLIDFDEGNLFALSRFPGYDRTAEGLRGSLAVGYTLRDPAGWSLGTTVGRAFWAEDPGLNAVSAGLDGLVSDWLVSVQADHGAGFSLDARALVADFGSVSRSETRLAWQTDSFALAAGHTYARSDPADRRLRASSEWTLDAGYRISDTWSSSVDASYNATEATFVDARAGLRYENECVRLDLSLSRNFATSATVTPVTDFTFAVAFGGYGDRRAARRSC